MTIVWPSLMPTRLLAYRRAKTGALTLLVSVVLAMHSTKPSPRVLSDMRKVVTVSAVETRS